jgi:hypothetical protein
LNLKDATQGKPFFEVSVMAEKGFVDVRWIEALHEFRRAHNGRNPNTFEAAEIRASLKSR